MKSQKWKTIQNDMNHSQITATLKTNWILKRWSDSGRADAVDTIDDAGDVVGPDNEDEITSLLLVHENRSGSQHPPIIPGANNDSDSGK